MRVGGPYTVKVSFVGYGTYTQDNITLSLGQNYVVNAVLTENLFTLDEVVATATRTTSLMRKPAH